MPATSYDGASEGLPLLGSNAHSEEGATRAMSAEVNAAAVGVVERLHQAINEHDLGAFVACFDSGYRSEQPAHPNRGFGGREQVEKNWSALFGSIPDFHADLLTTASARETLFAEWHWTGTRENESPFEMRGVTVFEIRNGRIVAGRLYMEEVEEAGADIDQTVRRLAEGTQLEPGTS